jgi:hypothetical protein
MPTNPSLVQIVSTEGVSLSQSHGELYDRILLDSQSSVDYFANPQLLTDIKKSDVELKLSTNAGSTIVTQKGTVPDWGEVWHQAEGIANTLSLSNMIKKHRVTFDSAEEVAFRVHTPKGIVKFNTPKQVLMLR